MANKRGIDRGFRDRLIREGYSETEADRLVVLANNKKHAVHLTRETMERIKQVLSEEGKCVVVAGKGKPRVYSISTYETAVTSCVQTKPWEHQKKKIEPQPEIPGLKAAV